MAKNDDYKARVEELRSDIRSLDTSADEFLSGIRKDCKDDPKRAALDREIKELIGYWSDAGKMRRELQVIRETYYAERPDYQQKLADMEAERQSLERQAMAGVRDAETEADLEKASKAATAMLKRAMEIHYEASKLRAENRKPRETTKEGPTKLETSLKALHSYMVVKGLDAVHLTSIPDTVMKGDTLKHAIIKGTTDSKILGERVRRHAEAAASAGLELGYYTIDGKTAKGAKLMTQPSEDKPTKKSRTAKTEEVAPVVVVEEAKPEKKPRAKKAAAATTDALCLSHDESQAIAEEAQPKKRVRKSSKETK